MSGKQTVANAWMTRAEHASQQGLRIVWEAALAVVDMEIAIESWENEGGR